MIFCRLSNHLKIRAAALAVPSTILVSTECFKIRSIGPHATNPLSDVKNLMLFEGDSVSKKKAYE